DKGQEFDSAIQFWLDYWTSRRILPSGIDPLLIKAQISLESGFNPLAEPPQKKGKIRSAAGLMQVLSGSLRVMSGAPDKRNYREMDSYLISLDRKDLFDPVVNIAAGIRWLAHKYSKIPKGNHKNIRNMIKNYNSWNKGGDTYAKKVFSRYEKSK
ncbi:MAG: transglycosylase SLT domain-containing protein, partial [Cyanobacteria bacterium NC_groundwater_1444_Ag_S-0.65um_54_12]|nr:transglycosylase SLT domain-containing protein [Cyanobacteria bacterium NC_groundwater_1444_Ag_S-0.65um_54_12]